MHPEKELWVNDNLWTSNALPTICLFKKIIDVSAKDYSTVI